MAVHGVVLAGGRGERFWPASRRGRPKPFLSLVSDRTMLAETLARLEGVADRTVVVVAADLEAAARAAVRDAGAEADVTPEPEARGTAAAIGLAAVEAGRTDPEAVLLVCPADHHIEDADAFREAARRAVGFAASRDALVCLGMAPTRPETGYGYILRAEEVAPGVHRVEGFVEKPTRERAEAFLRAGYLWNGGIFAFRASVYLEALGRHLPRTRAAMDAIAGAAASEGEALAAAQAYRDVEGVSIDVGVMERTDRAFVVPVSFAWDDVGAWTALERILPRGVRGNVARGHFVGIDADDLVVSTDEGIVAAIGVRDLVIVRAGDAVLVCPKGREQEVREILRKIEADPRLRRYL